MYKFALQAIFFVGLLFIISTQSYAASDNTSDFHAWLERYGAWDQIGRNYHSNSSDSAVDRARVYLYLDSPQKSLDIVEIGSSIADNATEIERLWIGGQAHRALGNLTKSVLWFTQASELMDSNTLKSRLKSEPGLHTIWKDVWLKNYWAYETNYSLSRDTQQGVLNKIASIGEIAWGDSYWEEAKKTLFDSNATFSSKAAPLPYLKISLADASLIAQALSNASLEMYDVARSNLQGIETQELKSFWMMMVDFIEKGANQSINSVRSYGNYLKATAFWTGNLLAPYTASRSEWVLGDSDSTSWTKFRDNVLAMPVTLATQAVDKELSSMLISEKTSKLLQDFKLALVMATGDVKSIIGVWNSTNKRTLPLSLKLAGIFFTKGNIKDVLPMTPNETVTVYPVLAALSGAAGINIRNNYESPFWVSIQQEQLGTQILSQYPFDKLLLLATLKDEFSHHPTDEVAKRAAFLFSGSSFANESLIYLANDAIRNKNLQLSAFYLNEIEFDSLSVENKMAWLDAKIAIELNSSHINGALSTFEKMQSLKVTIPVMTRLRVALLLQQQRKFDSAKSILISLLNEKKDLTTALEAEIMFWLGEGEQATGNTDESLEYYLKLAWKYPQENIWALTAMYRASLIYEKRGKYDTAKRLLKTVAKQADRKEQKEAAKARIVAIDKKMGNEAKPMNGSIAYPF